MRPLVYKILLGFTVLCTLGGILTLLPTGAASYPNIIGYKSLCTFAPAATFFCFFIAGLSCFIRSTLIKDSSGSAGQRIKKHGKSFIPLGIVLAAAIFSMIVFLNIKNQYTGRADTISAASEAVE